MQYFSCHEEINLSNAFDHLLKLIWPGNSRLVHQSNPPSFPSHLHNKLETIKSAIYVRLKHTRAAAAENVSIVYDIAGYCERRLHVRRYSLRHE